MVSSLALLGFCGPFTSNYYMILKGNNDHKQENVRCKLCYWILKSQDSINPLFLPYIYNLLFIFIGYY